MMFSGKLIRAAKDYRYLLDRSYPQKASIKLVGDRYQLSGQERSLLYRGISDKVSAGLRKAKIVCDPGDHALYVDCYNILFTVGNYLTGRPVYISDDGIVRDTGELRGRFGNKKIFERTISLVTDFMVSHSAAEYHFLLDAPVSNSGRLAQRLGIFMEENGLKGTAVTVRSPDHELIAVTYGLICTSDSVIMAKAKTGIFDMARHILSARFEVKFSDISDILTGDP